MKRFIKLMSLTIQGRMYYRAGFLLNLLTPVIVLAGQLMLWNSLYSLRADAPLASFSRPDMFSYILLAFGINNLLTWSSENSLSREIRSGAIVSRKIRPVPFLTQSLADMTGSLVLQGSVNLVLVVLAFLLFSSHLTVPRLATLPPFLLSLLLAVVLRMMLAHCFSLLCFFTTSHLGIAWTRQALTDFFSGALIPVALFPSWLLSLTYVLPFPLMLQVPISILLDQPLAFPLWQSYLLQCFWIALLWGCHMLLYRTIRRQATIAGG